MSVDLVAVPMPPELLARALSRHPDYRVLRRIQTMERHAPHGTQGLVGIALDLETTGLDHRTDEVIELALQRFRLDEFGRIIETGRPRGWLEQPSKPIPAAITRVTGIADPDVAGRSISDGEATAMLLGADFVVAHNASFDRRFLEKRLPLAAGRCWACSLNDVDWASLEFEGRTLSGLLMQMGYFYEAHRATTDVAALLQLLDHNLDEGGTIAARMVERAREPTWVIDALDAPFSAKEVLKDRGYRWDPLRRIWSVVVREGGLSDEVEWATLMLYAGRRSPGTRKVTWEQRYAAE
ncbi:3'-5' exonuclease [Sphingomonas parapaucimobilis]|uniref:3'-5' exonuclease n=2 Tax=Sphingomonas TaxID=13687 RepID=UPI00321B2A80